MRPTLESSRVGGCCWHAVAVKRLPCIDDGTARRIIKLSASQKLVIAAYVSVPSTREAALVLGASEQKLLEKLHLIRAAFRAAGYTATASRPALLKAARDAHQLPTCV